MVRTDVACASGADWKGVAVYVGEPGVDVESKAPALTSTSCDANGQVGSLVVVPTGSDSGRVAVRVVAGLTRNPEECAEASYEGCIVSRRSLTYLPHQAQTVVVDLSSDCLGNPCDLNHTCVEGSCTDTVTAAAPVAADGGVVFVGPTVRCGDDGTRCPANDPSLVCCVTENAVASDSAQGNAGTCMTAMECPPTNATLYCDDSSDCPADADGGAQVCCASVIGAAIYVATCTTPAQCSVNAFSNDEVLCAERLNCPASGLACAPDTHLNGYFGCLN